MTTTAFTTRTSSDAPRAAASPSNATSASWTVTFSEAVAGVDRVALVLGSEGHGLSSRWEQSAARRAVIPMAAGIDSLNVAAAGAVAFWALRAPA